MICEKNLTFKYDLKYACLGRIGTTRTDAGSPTDRQHRKEMLPDPETREGRTSRAANEHGSGDGRRAKKQSRARRKDEPPRRGYSSQQRHRNENIQRHAEQGRQLPSWSTK